jgi:AcrR family transcriptional regulator
VSAATATGRPPGRPRSCAADQAILDSAIEVFAESGLDGLTVEGVAARAGVGKATIYRRYPCKVDLVIAAARALTEAESPRPDTGSVDGDLRAIARSLVRLVTTTVAGRAVPQLVAEAGRNVEMRSAQSQFIAGRRSGTMEAVRRGVERGELRADTDVEMVADLVAAPIFYRHLVSGDPLDARFADRVVAAALAPWRTPSANA